MRGERKREGNRKSVRKLWKSEEKEDQKVGRNICMKKQRQKNTYLTKRKVKRKLGKKDEWKGKKKYNANRKKGTKKIKERRKYKG